MKLTVSVRAYASLVLILCLLSAPVAVLAKKGEKNYKRGLEQERAMQWERAAQEFALAVAANPSDIEYQLHYRRAIFNASQRFMEQGRTLAEQGDFTGAYNAYRQAVGYDPINELAVSEMARMMRLQREKEGLDPTGTNGNGADRRNGTPSTGSGIVPTSYTGGGAQQRPSQDPSLALPPTRSEQLRVINYNGDLEGFIRKLGDELTLNVLFDRDFPKGRTVNVNLKEVTTARALDHIFLSQNLFFQKLDRRTILVADQSKRGQYQQLVLRTFYLSNIDPNEARSLIQSSLPPTAGRQPQVTPNKATNSITVRDTPENIRLIAELLRAIDKDRAEVVMDVNIYEVSRTNLLQIGNQLGSDSSLGNLGGLLPTSFLFGAGKERFNTSTTTTGTTTGKDPGKGGGGGTIVNAAATVLGGSFLLPASTISAFQAKDNTRLLAATQVHAFDSEQSTTRIGQKVPVQTAQVSPFGSAIGATNQAGQQAGVNAGAFGGTGFPVIQYQDTGLILKFTPQVFPNLDVQVKMEIESNDVIGGASNLTPTFSQRNVSGMARIPNNRTMMIASVAQDKHSDGRRGIPLLGLIPVLGRFFSTPTRNDVNSDIVITVTPRVIRAPTVEPSDIDQRPSGTLQAPVSESLEAMLVTADREDQLAAARALPKDVAIQMPAAPNTTATAVNSATTTTAADTQHAYVPAPKVLMGATAANAPTAGSAAAGVSTVNNTSAVAGGNTEAGKQPAPPVSNAVAPAASFAPISNTGANLSPVPAANVRPVAAETAGTIRTAAAMNTTPVPASEKTAVEKAATEKTTVEKTTVEKTATTIPAAKVAAPAATTPAPLAAMTEGGAMLYVLSGQKEMRVGEKQRLMLLVKTSTPLGLAAATLKFDPRFVAVRSVTHGSLFGEVKESLPTITPSIDPRGSLLALIAPAANTPINGMGVLLFVEIEAVAVGESDVTLDQTGIHLMSVAGQNVATQLGHTRLVVKQ
ncbi:MAG TPA: secretin N-terminal domain-containing protein [Pyrinomonadaceae bacterium]|nr:secretin N-terminal domain-containing protein [Pyrinomonadaceae bacterium]